MADVPITEAKLGSLEGKVAIITGGASGIGLAMVELVTKHGGIVAIGDMNQDAGQALEKKLRDSGSNARYHKVDVTKWDVVSSFFADVWKEHGKIDLVFANAGIGDNNDIFTDKLNADGSLAEPDLLTMDVNVTGVLFTTKLALHYFKKNSTPGGGLVLTGSTSSYNERPNLPVYSTAKHAVIGLMRAVRHNAPKDNINVGAIAPGGTESSLFTPAAADAFRAQGIPVNRASAVALAAVYLANNKETNGQAITIIGEKFTEVEASVASTQRLWYGEYNTDMAVRAASVRLDQLSKNR